MVNVVQNACQAMTESPSGDGRAVLRIGAYRVGDWLEIRTNDTGPGIAPELFDRVFEPLYSTRSFGVGLGLPLVKQVLTEHRGQVEVDSSPGVGTTLILRLPCSRAPATPAPLGQV